MVSVIKVTAKIFLLTEVSEKLENEFVKNELFPGDKKPPEKNCWHFIFLSCLAE